MIPGSNILSMALTIIAPTIVQYYATAGRTTGTQGYYQPQYADPVPLSGSLQPVPRQQYAQLQLDWNKSYSTFYTSQSITDVQRPKAPDKIVFGGQTYICQATTPWFNIDGWDAVICVLTLGAPG